MNDFIKKYAIEKKTYKECLIPKNKEYLIYIKRGGLAEDIAIKTARLTDDDTYNVKEMCVTDKDIVNQKGIDILDKVKFALLERKFREDLLERHTIPEWEIITGVHIIDPDGFDRKTQNFMNDYLQEKNLKRAYLQAQ